MSPPPRPAIRALMRLVYPSTQDFLAFCQDCFTTIHQRLNGEMQRVQLENILFEQLRAPEKVLPEILKRDGQALRKVLAEPGALSEDWAGPLRDWLAAQPPSKAPSRLVEPVRRPAPPPKPDVDPSPEPIGDDGAPPVAPVTSRPPDETPEGQPPREPPRPAVATPIPATAFSPVDPAPEVTIPPPLAALAPTPAAHLLPSAALPPPLAVAAALALPTGPAPEGPANLSATSGSGAQMSDPKRNPGLWIIFWVLISLLVGGVFVILNYSKSAGAQENRMLLSLLVAIFSLVTATVLTKALGASAELWHPGFRFGGAAAIFFATFKLMVWGMTTLGPVALVIDGHIDGLPVDRRASIRARNCGGETEISSQGDFRLELPEACGGRSRELELHVADHEAQALPFKPGEPFRHLWSKGVEDATRINGSVVGPQQQPVPDVVVKFFSPCRDATKVEPVITASDGSFTLHDIPPGCRKPPYILQVHIGNTLRDFKIDGPYSTRLQLTE